MAVPILGALALFFSLAGFRLMGDEDARSDLVPIILGSVGFRLLLFIGVRQTVGPYVFAPDAWAYEIVGSEIVQSWDGLREMPEKATGSLQVGYYFLNAILQRVFGPSPAAAPILNIFFGAWAAAPVYFLAKVCVQGNRGVARCAAVLVAFFPSLMLWSVLNIREAPTGLVVVSAVYFFVKLQMRFSPRALISGLACLGMILLSREYLTALIAVSVPVGLLMARGKSPTHTMVGGFTVLILGVVGMSFGGLGANLVAEPALDTLELLRRGLAQGATSAYGAGHDVSSVGGAVTFLPIGLSYFLLAPFPWQMGSALQSVTMPEILIWYALIPFTIRGVALGVRKDPRSFLVLLAVLVTIVVAYALVQGNVGTAFRHRAQILPLLFVFSAIGIRDWYGAKVERNRFAAEKRQAATRHLARGFGRPSPQATRETA